MIGAFPCVPIMITVLFVCSRNRWRSPTAEHIWRKHPRVQARSAGTSPNAKRRLSAGDLHWADVIIVMEHEHTQRIRAGFGNAASGKPIHVLDIPDQYRYGDPELVEQLQAAVAALLDLE